LLIKVRESALRLWAWLSTHVSNWVEAYFWLPLVMGGVIFFNEFVKRADPQSGSDGLGALTGYAMLGVKGVLIMIFTWILKRGMFDILARRHIRDLQAKTMAYDDQEEGAKFVLKLETVQWVICLVAACFVFSG
jgi:hypothetical protein